MVTFAGPPQTDQKERTMPALIFEKRNHIAYLTMNRPEVHNSLNPEMLVSLAAAWKGSMATTRFARRL
jgi:enoyl-CoA hydratase/carnithine racemase